MGLSKVFKNIKKWVSITKDFTTTNHKGFITKKSPDFTMKTKTDSTMMRRMASTMNKNKTDFTTRKRWNKDSTTTDSTMTDFTTTTNKRMKMDSIMIKRKDFTTKKVKKCKKMKPMKKKRMNQMNMNMKSKSFFIFENISPLCILRTKFLPR